MPGLRKGKWLVLACLTLVPTAARAQGSIAGVVKDSKYHRVTESPQPYFYIPIRQIFRPEYGLTFDVRTSGSVNEDASTYLRCPQ